MVALELKLEKDPFELRGEGWVGQGIGEHWLRYYMGFNSLTGDEIRSQGGFLSLLYKTPIKGLSLGCGAGVDHATKSDLKGWDFIQKEDGGKTGLDYDRIVLRLERKRIWRLRITKGLMKAYKIC